MASNSWILLCCIFLSLDIGCLGLDFSIVRTPGQPICARLRCSNSVSGDVNSYSHSRLTIYDVTQAGRRSQLATIAAADYSSLIIDSARSGTVSGTGSISKTQAEITLDLSNEADCVRGSYQCELEFVNVKGKKDVVSTSVEAAAAGSDDDCSCASISKQFLSLTNRANEADRTLAVLRQSNAELDNEVADLRQENSENENDIAKLKYNSTAQEGAINALRQTDKDNEAEIAGLRRSDQTIEDALASLRGNDKAHQGAIVDLRRSDELQLAGISELRQNDRVIENDLNSLKRNDSEIAEDLIALKRKDAKIQDDIAEQRRTTRVLQQEINDLKHTDEVINEDINALRRNDKVQGDAVDVLRSNDAAQEQDIANLKQADKGLQEEIGNLQKSDSAFDAAVTELRKRDQVVEEELAVSNNNDKTTSDAIASLNQNQKNIDEVLIGLRQNDINLQQQIDDLKRGGRGLGEGLARLTQVDEVINADIASLRQANALQVEQLNRQSQNYTALQQELNQLRQQRLDLQLRVAGLSAEVAKIQSTLNATRVTTVTRTTTSLVQVSCYRGMPHNLPREKVLLYGTTPALCDTETDGGGWIVVQRRTNGVEDFYRGWDDYKNGFGKIDSDYWIGNNAINNLTSQGFNELRVDLQLDGQASYAQYSVFRVGNEYSNYKLSVSGYSGNAGDSLEYHDGQAFSTKDRDNDNSPDSNCAEVKSGAWWYNSCYRSNLNGLWGRDSEEGVIWKSLNESRSVSFTEIKIRRNAYAYS